MRLDTWLRNAVLAVCVVYAIAAPALAQKSADTLRITWREAIPDVDPYYNSQRTGMGWRSRPSTASCIAIP